MISGGGLLLGIRRAIHQFRGLSGGGRVLKTSQHVEAKFFYPRFYLFGNRADAHICSEDNDQFKQHTPYTDGNGAKSGEKKAKKEPAIRTFLIADDACPVDFAVPAQPQD
jgi:hypothetical protein